jgi:hypothetical protein
VTREETGGKAAMAIIKQYHKDTDTTYVYDSVSYWDAEKGQSRSKRKLLGKLDPITGEIIPTGQRGRKKKECPVEDPEQVEAKVTAVTAGYLEKIQQQELTIRQQQAQITELSKRIAQMEDTISKAAAILGRERK